MNLNTHSRSATEPQRAPCGLEPGAVGPSAVVPSAVVPSAISPPAGPGHDSVSSGDSPSGGPGDGPVSGGLGLIGMRERVAALGGTLRAGPRADGSFRVTALLPRTAS